MQKKQSLTIVVGCISFLISLFALFTVFAKPAFAGTIMCDLYVDPTKGFLTDTFSIDLTNCDAELANPPDNNYVKLFIKKASGATVVNQNLSISSQRSASFRFRPDNYAVANGDLLNVYLTKIGDTVTTISITTVITIQAPLSAGSICRMYGGRCVSLLGGCPSGYTQDGVHNDCGSSFICCKPTNAVDPNSCSGYNTGKAAVCVPGSTCPVAGCSLAAPAGGYTDCPAGANVCCQTINTPIGDPNPTKVCDPVSLPNSCYNLLGQCLPTYSSCPSGWKSPNPPDCQLATTIYKTNYGCCNVTIPAGTPTPILPPVIVPPKPEGPGPVPVPPVDCDETRTREFHSLRPYQASPCRTGATNLKMACANDFMGLDAVTVGVEDARKDAAGNPLCSPQNPETGWQTCQFEILVNKNVNMTYPDAELSILGNTQLVQNSTNENGNPWPFLSPADRVNDYVSWYLNGTSWRAEEDPAGMGGDATDTQAYRSQCIGRAIANYFNNATEGVNQNGRVQFLSPVFNLTSNLSPDIFRAFTGVVQKSRIDGYAGNVYYDSGISAWTHYENGGWPSAFAGKPVHWLEFGNHDDPQNVGPVAADFNTAAAAGIDSISLFNALGTGGSEFADYKLEKGQIDQIFDVANGVFRNRSGINSASPIDNGNPSSFSQSVGGLNSGIRYVVEMIESPADLAKTVEAVNNNNFIHIIRLCSGSTCGFSDPTDLKNFINKLNDGRLTKNVWLVVGPNEPDLESWASSACGSKYNSYVDFAGPIRKLLPWYIQAKERYSVISDATTQNGIRHDQVVACAAQQGVFQGVFDFGRRQPAPCYTTAINLNDKDSALRLTSWNGTIPTNPIPIPIINLGYTFYWNNRKPPLGDEPEFQGPNGIYDYWRAYQEWRGKFCLPFIITTPTIYLPIFGNVTPLAKQYYACIDDPTNYFSFFTWAGFVFRQSHWSKLFTYIPFTSTEDRVGKVYVKSGLQTPMEGYTTQEVGSPVIDVRFNPEQTVRKDMNLYFSHTEEILKLGQMLKSTYVPKNLVNQVDAKPQNAPGGNTDSALAIKEFYNSSRCEVRNARWNSGDQLFAKSPWPKGASAITGLLAYKVAFVAPVRDWMDTCCYDGCAEGTPSSLCPPGCNSGDEGCYQSHFDNCEESVTNCQSNCLGSPVCSDVSKPDCQTCLARCNKDCDQIASDFCTPKCTFVNRFTQEYSVAMSSWTQTPLIDEIWDGLVFDKGSVFKRIYPNGLLQQVEIIDLPGVTTGNYGQGRLQGGPSCTEGAPGCINGGGNFREIYAGALISRRPGTRADLTIPHLGGIYEYFLKGIQQALRPLGLGPGPLPSANEDQAKPKPADVEPTCGWDGYGCHYFVCQCDSWDASTDTCVNNDWHLPDQPAGTCAPPIGCGKDLAPMCESGRCNPYEIRIRQDYWKECGGSTSDPDSIPWPFSPAENCWTDNLCQMKGFEKNPEGGYGPCHYQNAGVCVRTDGIGGCAGVCNRQCC